MIVIDNDIKTLRIIANNPNGRLESKASWIGFQLYPKSNDRRWPQGMALCGGKAISRLVKLGLIMVSPGDFKDGTSIYRITGDGRNTLSKMEQENKDE
jgi:hypothetical protein